MFDILIKWVLLALSLLFVAWIVPGISFAGFMAALWSALLIGIINIFIRPILLFLTLPLNLLTLGLFTFIINAFLFWVVSHIVPGFMVADFMAALLGSILLSVISLFLNRVDE